MTIEYTLEDLPIVAKQILTNVSTKIVLFDADMGMGKTTLIKEICKQLGVQDIISSPTYSLVNEYDTETGPIYHFDFYRIEDEEEAYHIGFEEYLDSNNWVFIEWPEKVSNILPKDVSIVKINLSNNDKRILLLNS
ncbi:tRNA (adenosine(37)-N6)-threonylcarbamoyltransferase complex ATPase subunit type 1 TsaE [Aquimarina sp. AD10]|uniref:tRNA threonylcarbamoyladenosine biosynthesis protein TsaE n=1 Tax=Aquimarina aggregata TaxID=1642818 RepID=A0A163C9I9_9FLAO|nr:MULTISPECIES: tRNA (adenosine(37)-N6)-threonylcarbamoyltransferase complex ATPase subunit type 1 TsaE [Aquimarina]AXT59823.1 tRNA (adenosine(37)-N6)-threonylcarbamoyltransferase complex ATPase subunit type 1 TsaE [Aquimarina sp. AD10]KZS42190.1 tRNA threonylcarbamoyladenosine biosynthesis protein TsaE [Aquimarina aggregata]RKM97694.1 tRNA (adenosine(37)-N6)-threonylcarbamoyltransferase complex ATPase subunit type 1 TsaE [Aquimarina sp. AD10]